MTEVRADRLTAYDVIDVDRTPRLWGLLEGAVRVARVSRAAGWVRITAAVPGRHGGGTLVVAVEADTPIALVGEHPGGGPS